VERIEIAARPDWRAKAEALGFDWHSAPTPEDPGALYWDETAYWRLTASEVEVLEAATEELHAMCLAAADRAITKKLLRHFGFDARAIALIEHSWRTRDTAPSLYGRFDLAYGGEGVGDGHPKLLEYNADTPTGLYEAAVVQWAWLQELFPESDQFNSIHEGLVAAWAGLKDKLAVEAGRAGMHFTCLAPHSEDEGTLRYLLDTALEAGLSVKNIPVAEIGWSAPPDEPDEGDFVDLDDNQIRTLFKLVPWDWMLADDFGARLVRKVVTGEITVIEPGWKMVIANKAILALLWEMYPNHPNLLPAFMDRTAFASGSTVVAKPLLGREGANISMAVLGENGAIVGEPIASTPGAYGQEGYVYQARAPLASAPDSAGRVHQAVIGSWMVDGFSRGIGIREDTNLITNNRSRFVPHLF
jgi:glutathionylspermidine synthase